MKKKLYEALLNGDKYVLFDLDKIEMLELLDELKNIEYFKDDNEDMRTNRIFYELSNKKPIQLRDVLFLLSYICYEQQYPKYMDLEVTVCNYDGK